MKRSIRSSAEHLLMLFAFVWPWDACQYVPVLQVHLTEVLALALIVLCAAEVLRWRRFRVPFELIWPAFLLLCVAVYAALRGYLEEPVTAVGCLLLFLATAHFARRGLVVQCLKLMAVSGAGVGALSMAARHLGIVPTAYGLESAASLVAARNLPSGALTLVICSAAGLAYLDAPPAKRGRWVIAAAIPVVPLVALAVQLFPQWTQIATWRPADLAGGPFSVTFVKLAALWITASVAAKLAVCRKERRDGSTAALLCAIAAGGLFTLAFTWDVAGGHALILGLSVAAARRGAVKEASTISAMRLAVLAASAAFICCNLWVVFPENLKDPRNYDTVAAEDLAHGRLDLLERRLAFFESRVPTERRTHLWRAHVALARNQLHRAAGEFAQAVERSGTRPIILPWPTLAQQDDFLVRLRDACSTVSNPDRVFAYERALVAVGNEGQALSALRGRLCFGSMHVPEDMSGAPLRSVLAILLAGQPIAGWPQDLTPGEMAGILRCAGAEIGPAPEGFPPALLPLAVVARFGADGMTAVACGGEAGANVAAWHGRGREEGQEPLRLGPTDPSADVEWSAFVRGDGGLWISSLTVKGKPLAELRAGERCVFALAEQAGDVKETPDNPVIRIWLP